MVNPTQRQIDFIEDIQNIVGARFEGITKQEASEFIDANIDDFHRIKKNGRALDESIIED